jgi:hypothetical protein
VLPIDSGKLNQKEPLSGSQPGQGRKLKAKELSDCPESIYFKEPALASLGA